MPETLLSPSKIWMYGRVLEDILLVQANLKKGPGGSGAGDNKFLFHQFKSRIRQGDTPQEVQEVRDKLKDKFIQEMKKIGGAPANEEMDELIAQALAAVKAAEPADPVEGARLARIYAMSFEGTFYNLPKPAIFLVHGLGTDLPSKGFAAGKPGQSDMDASGMAARDFEWESDLKYWEYDKDDVSLRLDVVTGTLDDILIDATLSPTSDYPIASRGQLAAQGQVALRGQLITRGQMMARNRLQE